MATSMLAAVREAIHASAATISPDDGEDPGAAEAVASTQQETAMSKENAPAGGKDAGIPQAEHDAAVTAAEKRGGEAATARLSKALGADGIKGDAGRMSAALDLAVKSPGMSAEEVAGFVTANVAKSGAAVSYEEKRLADAGLAQPGSKPQGESAKTNWAEFRAKRQKAG